MNKRREDTEPAASMDAEEDSFVTIKRRARKRKEDSSDSSDSEARKLTVPKRKMIISSSDEETTTGSCKKGILFSAKQLLKLLGEIRAYDDLKLARKMATQVCEMAQKIEAENAELKAKLASSTSIDARISAMDAKLNGVVKTIKELSSASNQKTSYAEKARSSAAASLESAKTTKRHIVTVFPEQESKIADSEETKKAIISSMAPTKEKLRIVNVRKINNKGVLIETKTEEDLKNVIANDKLKAAGLTVGIPAKLRPKIIIKNVPSALQEKEILSAVRHQNLDTYSKEKFNENFKLAFKTGAKEKEVTNWVAEVSPEIREKIIKEGRLYIQWHACYAQDFLSISRCYKCQSFGHVSKYCKASTETCGHCAENGHSHKNCKAAKDHPRCVNCKRAGKPHDHSSRATDCPAYQNALRMHASKIDYGQK